MGTIPTTPTFTAGAILTAAELNSLSTAIDYWADPPRCALERNTDVTVSDQTWTLGTYETELYDTDTMFDSGTNNRMVVQTAGVYEVQASLRFLGNNNGNRGLMMRINSNNDDTQGTVIGRSVFVRATIAGAGGSATLVSPVYEVNMDVADYFQVFVWQNCGVSLDLDYLYLRARLKGPV